MSNASIANLSGVIPPVIVPLNDDRSFDRESYVTHLERLIASGVHGLFILGSSGEVAFSTRERRQEILEATMNIVDGRLPVLAGVVDTQTERVLEHVRDAEAAGVDGLVATAPFYALGGLEVVEAHFRAIAKATDLPVYAYDIPVCVNVKLPVDLLMRLAADGVIAGVKDSSGDDVAFRWLCQANEDAGHPLRIFTGHEVVVDGAYLSGADGSVPGLGNVDPDGYVRQWDAYQNGDWETVRAEQERIARLMHIVTVTSGVSGFGAGIGGFKTALQLLNVIKTNQMPLPVARMEGENVEAVRKVLQEANLI
ncbi:MAG TPA: dihydrodipicolinate synthase family protein [Corynebacterium stationis]|nr:dihydrodipicolinate synthase family protein [Corynebacterium stationis]